MTLTFWIIAAAMTIAVTALLWWTLGARGDASAQRRRALAQAHAAGVIDDAEFARKQAELDAQGPATTSAAPRSLALPIALAVILPVLAFALYRMIGTPTAITPVKPDTTKAAVAAAADPHASANGADAPEMEKAITDLAARLATSPEDVDGWLLLARAYKATQRYAESFDAMTKALALTPDSPEVQLEHAESEALAAPDRRFTERGRGVLAAALAADASNQRALWLSGIDAVQREAYADAVRHWQALESQLDPASDIAQSVRDQIARARQVGGLDGAAPPSVAATPAAEASEPAAAAAATAGANAVTVNVDITPALRARLGEGDTLFVFARAAVGPKMPLAIQKRSASMLPLTLTLDDSMGMMPSMKLSSADTLVFGARVSSRGDATPAPGDLQVISAPIVRTSIDSPIKLTIDEVVR